MQYRTLGRTGVGLTNYLGTWDPRADKERRLAQQAIERAITLGINHKGLLTFVLSNR